MHLTRRELLHYFGATAATGLIGPGCIGWTREEAHLRPVDNENNEAEVIKVSVMYPFKADARAARRPSSS